MSEEIAALVVLGRESFGQETVHLRLMLWRHAVPNLRSPIVQIIYTMQISILCMPEQHTPDVSWEMGKDCELGHVEGAILRAVVFDDGEMKHTARGGVTASTNDSCLQPKEVDPTRQRWPSKPRSIGRAC